MLFDYYWKGLVPIPTNVKELNRPTNLELTSLLNKMTKVEIRENKDGKRIDEQSN